MSFVSMKKNVHVAVLVFSFLSMIGCAQDSEISSRCDPCPEGFVCTDTPFGTFDCLPVRMNVGYDGSGGNQSFDASAAIPQGDMYLSEDFSLDGQLPLSDSGLELDDRGLSSIGPDAGAIGGATPGIDASMPIVDSLPLPQKPGRAAAGRVTRLDIPTNVIDARLSGCTVVGQNAGSGLSGVLTILGATLTEQFQPDENNEIPLILLTDFVDWRAGMTSTQYAGGTLEFHLGVRHDSGGFAIDPSVLINGVESDESRIRFETSFTGETFTTNDGLFHLETSSFGLPFSVELQFASMNGRVAVSDAGVSVRNTALNGYLSFSGVRRIVMAIQTFCTESPSDSFCRSANRFLDGDPSTPELDGDTAQIARDVILPLMRNLDTRLTNAGPVSCDPFCDSPICVQCNAVSVCGLIETVPVELE